MPEAPANGASGLAEGAGAGLDADLDLDLDLDLGASRDLDLALDLGASRDLDHKQNRACLLTQARQEASPVENLPGNENNPSCLPIS